MASFSCFNVLSELQNLKNILKDIMSLYQNYYFGTSYLIQYTSKIELTYEFILIKFHIIGEFHELITLFWFEGNTLIRTQKVSLRTIEETWYI